MKVLHIKVKNACILQLVFLLLLIVNVSNGQYRLIIHPVSKDTIKGIADESSKLMGTLKRSFPNSTACSEYIYKLPALLATKGFPAASVDSVFFDSTSAIIGLYTGKEYKWVKILRGNADEYLLDASGYNEKQYLDKRLDFSQIQLQQQRMIDALDNSGYPFGSVYLDSISMISQEVGNGFMASWKVLKGPLYHIDSIRIYGNVKIRNNFIQRYLGIQNGSLFNRSKLKGISKRMLELPYLQEQQHWDITLLGTGSVVNLYLQSKKSSQVNFLIGFLPSTTTSGKSQLTGDVNLNLKNSLGSGESILLNWQQLQRLSPRLNLGYQQPYIFNSPFGIDFGFALLKRDSSYVLIQAQLGLQYLLSSNQSGKIFFQNERTYLLSGGIDTNKVIFTKKLPQNIDVNSSSIGMAYEWSNTNYRYNPRVGNELNIVATTGLKKISRNNDILNLKDPSNPSFSFATLYDSLKLTTFQLRLKFSGAHYFPIGKRATLKNAVNAGWFESKSTFRNELFQIGGYKLLRGFNEESIYASQYAVLTEELRYLVGLNSYLFFFTDLAATRTHFQSTDFSNSFIGAGVGLAFETKFGLLNFSYGLGKRNDVKFDIREASKIHFGYVNYF